MRIVGATGFELGERQEGRLEFKGPSSTSGYYLNADATRKLFDGEWLDTGDYAYLADGEIYLTGRVKDVIIRGGRNIYPYELEQAVGDIAGVRRGCVAVFGCADPASGTERLVVLAETRETDAAAREKLRQMIGERAVDVLGMPADEVVLAPPHTVLKTSSGKIRRAASREFYERGGKSTRPAPVWWQFVRLALAGAMPQLRRLKRGLNEVLYAAYAWALFWVLAPLVWAAVAASGRPRHTHPLIHGAARLILRLTRTPLMVSGLENLPRTACVLAANHASYLDACCSAPRCRPISPHAFVAKREFMGHFVPRLFLRGLGAVFVDRFDARQGVEHVELPGCARANRCRCFSRKVRSTAGRGCSRSVAELLRLARAGVPVVPIAIRGARLDAARQRLVSIAAQPASGLARPSVPRLRRRDGDALRDQVRAEIPGTAENPISRIDPLGLLLHLRTGVDAGCVVQVARIPGVRWKLICVRQVNLNQPEERFKCLLRGWLRFVYNYVVDLFVHWPGALETVKLAALFPEASEELLRHWVGRKLYVFFSRWLEAERPGTNDPASDKWSKKKDMPLAHHVALAITRQDLRTGVSNIPMPDCVAPIDNVGVRSKNDTKARAAAHQTRSLNAAVVNGKITIGGAIAARLEGNRRASAQTLLGANEVNLRPIRQTRSAMPTARNHAAVGVVDNKIYIIAGGRKCVYHARAIPTSSKCMTRRPPWAS